MRYYIRNANKAWKPEQIRLIEALAEQNTPTPVIAFKVGKTVAAIRSKAGEIGLSLKPTNQRPYTRSL